MGFRRNPRKKYLDEVRRGSRVDYRQSRTAKWRRVLFIHGCAREGPLPSSHRPAVRPHACGLQLVRVRERRRKGSRRPSTWSGAVARDRNAGLRGACVRRRGLWWWWREVEVVWRVQPWAWAFGRVDEVVAAGVAGRRERGMRFGPGSGQRGTQWSYRYRRVIGLGDLRMIVEDRKRTLVEDPDDCNHMSRRARVVAGAVGASALASVAAAVRHRQARARPGLQLQMQMQMQRDANAYSTTVPGTLTRRFSFGWCFDSLRRASSPGPFPRRSIERPGYLYTFAPLHLRPRTVPLHLPASLSMRMLHLCSLPPTRSLAPYLRRPVASGVRGARSKGAAAPS